MAEEKLYTTGALPIDLTGVEAAYEGETHYETGVCTFRVKGCTIPDNGKKQVRMVHEILDGPGEGHENKGRSITRTLSSNSDGAKKFVKGYFQRIGGERGYAGNKPQLDAVVGVVFKANLYKEGYTAMDEKSGKEVSRTKYAIDMNTLEIISRPGGGTKSSEITMPT